MIRIVGVDRRFGAAERILFGPEKYLRRNQGKEKEIKVSNRRRGNLLGGEGKLATRELEANEETEKSKEEQGEIEKEMEGKEMPSSALVQYHSESEWKQLLNLALSYETELVRFLRGHRILPLVNSF